MKLVPENKAFLLGVSAFIVLLIGFQSIRTIMPKASKETNRNYTEIRRLIAREMIIRQRHAQLMKASKAWDELYLVGTPREASIGLLKKVQQWAGFSGLSYEVVRILEEPSESEKNRAGVSIRGSGKYQAVLEFIRQVEHADFMISMTSLQLKKESSGGGDLRFEMTVIAPLRAEGRPRHE